MLETIIVICLRPAKKLKKIKTLLVVNQIVNIVRDYYLLFQRFRLQSKTDDVFFLIDWGRCRGDLPKIGDIVKLTDSATFLYYEFLKVGHLWYDEMNNTMLGKVYKVLERPKNTTVTLPSPDGNGKWYFPKSTVYCNRVALALNCPKIAPSEFSLNPH